MTPRKPRLVKAAYGLLGIRHDQSHNQTIDEKYETGSTIVVNRDNAIIRHLCYGLFPKVVSKAFAPIDRNLFTHRLLIEFECSRASFTSKAFWAGWRDHSEMR